VFEANRFHTIQVLSHACLYLYIWLYEMSFGNEGFKGPNRKSLLLLYDASVWY